MNSRGLFMVVAVLAVAAGVLLLVRGRDSQQQSAPPADTQGRPLAGANTVCG